MSMFTVLGNPIPKGRPRFGKGRVFTPLATREWEAQVQAYARKAQVRLTLNPVELTLYFFRDSERRCDLDNLEKAVKDALNGIAWEDDSQVFDCHKHKRVDRENPRVVVMIREMDLNEFERGRCVG